MVELTKLRYKIEHELSGNILPFWLNTLLEKNRIVGSVSNRGVIDKNAPIGLVMVARFLWTYSEAYYTYKDNRYLEISICLRDYLLNNFLDKKFGGFYWMLDYKGRPVDKKKIIYGQAFVLYGLSAFYKINPDDQDLLFCRELYSLIERYGLDSEFNGYYDGYLEDWTYTNDNCIAPLGILCDKSMNTNLHILEAYTMFYKISSDGALKDSLINLLGVIKNIAYNAGNGHQNQIFLKDWSVVSDLVSYGHDVETSWLVWDAVELLDDDNLREEYRDYILKLLDTSMLEGTDSDGSLYNETFVGVTDRDRIWWVQAEYLVSLLNAWEITGELKYKNSIFKVWDYIENNIIDQNSGEWYWLIDESGNPGNMEKGGFWKTSYHNARACFEFLKRVPVLR